MFWPRSWPPESTHMVATISSHGHRGFKSKLVIFQIGLFWNSSFSNHHYFFWLRLQKTKLCWKHHTQKLEIGCVMVGKSVSFSPKKSKTFDFLKINFLWWWNQKFNVYTSNLKLQYMLLWKILYFCCSSYKKRVRNVRSKILIFWVNKR